MATYLEIRNRVSSRVIDLPSSVQAEVPKLVNEAMRTMQRKHNFRAMEKFAFFTTAVGTRILGTIDRFKEFRDQGPLLFHKFRKAQRLPIDVASGEANKSELQNATYPKSPQHLASIIDPITGVVTFIVSPFPDALSDWTDGNYQITIPYYEYSAALINDNDTNWFTQNADDYIAYQATGEAFALDWDYDSEALWLQRADVKNKEIVKADKMSRLGGVNMLVPHWKGANEPKVYE